MRRFALVFFSLVLASPLYAACGSPAAPVCATQTAPFASVKAADDCRKEMLTFRDGMDAYAACLGQTSAVDEKQARDAYEDVWVRFNRRARGEYGQVPRADKE
jgi:hypothetical protein